MKLSKKQRKEIIECIELAVETARECAKKYGGSRYFYLCGAFEAVFSDILNITNVELMKILGEEGR